MLMRPTVPLPHSISHQAVTINRCLYRRIPPQSRHQTRSSNGISLHTRAWICLRSRVRVALILLITPALMPSCLRPQKPTMSGRMINTLAYCTSWTTMLCESYKAGFPYHGNVQGLMRKMIQLRLPYHNPCKVGSIHRVDRRSHQGQ